MKIERHAFGDTILLVRLWAESEDDLQELRKTEFDLKKYTNNLATMIDIDGQQGLSIIFKPKPHEGKRPV